MKLSTIHEDNRGSINLLLDDLRCYDEVTVFKTNRGYARGGCIHKLNDEFCVVIEGMILYQIGIKEELLYPGDSIVIPKKTPHYFESLTDSVVLEWGATPAEKKEKHTAFRRKVDKINDTVDRT